MCRFAAYLGKPLLINEVISKPKDSLIKQSASALESDIKINADGFGIGWYNISVSELPAVFVSTSPAWNDVNLKNITHQIVSTCFFGHIRAAEEGSVELFNCHPFHYKQYMLMHNGNIAGFKKIKLAIFNLLHEAYFLNIKGTTDSETLFALWLTFFHRTKQDHAGMIIAWRETLAVIQDLQLSHNIKETSYINALITDGTQITGVRYSSDPSACLSLHYTAGERFTHTKEGVHMTKAFSENKFKSIIIASEIMSLRNKSEWQEIPAQHIIAVDAKKNIDFLSLK